MNATTSPSGTSENGRDASSGSAPGTAATGAPSKTGNGAGFMGARRDAASLRSDLTQLKSDLDALMGRASSMSDQELSEAHDRILSQFSSMRHAARGMAAEASRQLTRSVDVTTDYVKDKPMQSVAVAAGLGLFLGMLLRRG